MKCIIWQLVINLGNSHFAFFLISCPTQCFRVWTPQLHTFPELNHPAGLVQRTAVIVYVQDRYTAVLRLPDRSSSCFRFPVLLSLLFLHL